jgi:succinoglycan biosynthesis transport protein ExoP
MLPTESDLTAVRVSSASLGAPGIVSASDDIFKVMWRNRWLVLLGVVVAVAAGFIYLRMAIPIYTSVSKLYVQQSAPTFLRTEYGEPQRYNLYTQAALLKSSRILAAALESPQLKNMKTFAGRDNPLAYVQQNIQVGVGKNDDTINVSFSSPYAAEASQIVNGVVDAFVAAHEENKRKASAEILESLQRERDRKKDELDQKRAELAELRKKNALLAMELDQRGVVTQELQRLSAALAEAKMGTVQAATLYGGVKARAKEPNDLREYLSLSALPASLDPTTSQRSSLSRRLFELELDRRGLVNSDLTGNHPRMKILDDEIRQITAEITRLDDQFIQSQLAAAEQRYLDAKMKEEQVSRLFEEQRAQAVTLNEQLIDHQLLASEIDELTEYLKTVQQQIREVNVNGDLELDATRIQVMEVARPAASPSSPQKRQAMAVALVMGLLLGGGLAVIRDWLDQKLHSAEEISTLLRLPILGVVPAMPRRQGLRTHGRVVLLTPESQEAEAFRTVRTALFFGAPSAKARTILITSPSGGDGKSTLVSNLGTAAASAGQKTIIVDADFRRPTQQVIFGVDRQEQCLSAVLAGRIKLSEAIRLTEVQGLSLLTCGPGIANPAETINSQNFARVLRCLSQVYDRVLIDAPPATMVTDAQILGALCDFTILVLRADKSTWKMAQRSIEVLQGVGARLLGVVVNGVRGSGSRYGYYRSRHRPRSAPVNSGGNGKKSSVQPAAGNRQPAAPAVSAKR